MASYRKFLTETCCSVLRFGHYCAHLRCLPNLRLIKVNAIIERDRKCTQGKRSRKWRLKKWYLSLAGNEFGTSKKHIIGELLLSWLLIILIIMFRYPLENFGIFPGVLSNLWIFGSLQSLRGKVGNLRPLFGRDAFKSPGRNNKCALFSTLVNSTVAGWYTY